YPAAIRHAAVAIRGRAGRRRRRIRRPAALASLAVAEEQSGRLRISTAMDSIASHGGELLVRAHLDAGALVSLEQRRRRARGDRDHDGDRHAGGVRPVARAVPRSRAPPRGDASGAVALAGRAARADLSTRRAGVARRHALRPRARLRGDAGAVHHLGAEELLRRGAACPVRGGARRWRVAGAYALQDRSAGRVAGPRRGCDLQSGRILVRVLAGARAARLAGAFHDAARPVQFSKRVRNRLAAARGGQLHRPRAGDDRVRPASALLRRRPDGGRGQRLRMTVDVHVVSHTHWDREWYLTREQFRLRLVDLIDRVPDLFGHVAQMPQILRQLGLDNAILWRGFGGRRAEYWWEAPDGSSVLLMHLPPEGYCNATRVAFNGDEMVARAMRAVDYERERTVSGQVLLMNGVDHVEPHPAIPQLVDRLSQNDGIRARHSTLAAYVDGVRRRVTREDA